MQPELKPIRTGEDSLGRGRTYDAAEIAAVAQSQKVLRNTYLLLALTMVPTVVGAFIVVTLENYLAQLGAWVTVVQGDEDLVGRLVADGLDLGEKESAKERANLLDRSAA